METLSHGGRDLVLSRFPLRHDDPLRAWDAADAHLLRRLAEDPPAVGVRTLVVGDAFGALTCALHHLKPVHWSDSYLGREATRFNLERNGLAADAVTFVPGDEDPVGPFDLVLLKAPKSLDRWADLLVRLRPAMTPETRLLTGSMVKHTSGRTYRLLDDLAGPTTTTLAWRKSRLAETEFRPGPVPPGPIGTVYDLQEFDLRLSARPGVFSAERLDQGARLLLTVLPESIARLRAADLGCGNGVLGLALARRCPGASVLFSDESDQAVASARENADVNGLADRDFEFVVGDGLAETDFDSLDLVLCNPPFHQAHAVGDLVAWRLFEQARRALRPGGVLLVVGNRHLGYHVKLARLFGGSETIASDRRFTVLQARLGAS